MDTKHRVEGYDAEFCLDSYLPELHAATESIELDQETRERLARGLVGTLIKEFYAVLWQVWVAKAVQACSIVKRAFLLPGDHVDR